MYFNYYTNTRVQGLTRRNLGNAPIYSRIVWNMQERESVTVMYFQGTKGGSRNAKRAFVSGCMRLCRLRCRVSSLAQLLLTEPSLLHWNLP